MNIIKYLKFIDILTMLNVVCGILTILFSIKGEMYAAVVFLLSAVIFDTLDGKASRYFKRDSTFGKELDSLSDIISFGVAPIVFVNSLIDLNIFNIIAYSIFLVCGTLRLSRFNITTNPFYEGMPITLNGLIIPFLFLINLPVYFFPYILILLGILMVSDFKVKKLFSGK